jgi:outer membrane lipoprotein LolB
MIPLKQFLLSTLLLCILLSGCAQKPRKAELPQVGSTSQQLQQKPSTLTQWQAEGRMAASHGQKGGNASFVWQQRGDTYSIKLFGPFGSGAIYITGNGKFVELKESNGKKTTAQSPEMLLQKVVGWQVPITGLTYWLRGLPTPLVPPAKQSQDNQGRLRYLTQQGWNIEYENYQADTLVPLPSKMQLQNGNTKIKIIITSWKRL